MTVKEVKSKNSFIIIIIFLLFFFCVEKSYESVKYQDTRISYKIKEKNPSNNRLKLKACPRFYQIQINIFPYYLTDWCHAVVVTTGNDRTLAI